MFSLSSISIGYTGSPGFIGRDGYTGSAGYQGVDGYIGSEGYVGSFGYTGSLGYTGSQGIPGQYVIDIQPGLGVTVTGIITGTVSTATIAIGQDVGITATVTFTNVVLQPGGYIEFQKVPEYSLGDEGAPKLPRCTSWANSLPGSW